MSQDMIEKVKRGEDKLRAYPQTNIPVKHFLHGGVYVRTVRIPAGIMITGAQIIIETVLILSGHAFLHNGNQWVEYDGYHVIPAAANRKQIFVAITDTDLTMFFPTDAKNVRDAEERFTSEASMLQNREAKCQE